MSVALSAFINPNLGYSMKSTLILFSTSTCYYRCITKSLWNVWKKALGTMYTVPSGQPALLPCLQHQWVPEASWLQTKDKAVCKHHMVPRRKKSTCSYMNALQVSVKEETQNIFGYMHLQINYRRAHRE